MHNVNTDALKQTIAQAEQDAGALKQQVSFDGEWQTQEGEPQFRATIPVPNGEPFVFEADFPPPMGGTGSGRPPTSPATGALGRRHCSLSRRHKRSGASTRSAKRPSPPGP